MELGVPEPIEIVSTGHAAGSRREARHVGRVRALGTGLRTGVPVGLLTDGSADRGRIEALDVRADARAIRTMAVWCRDVAWRRLADLRAWLDRPEVKTHDFEN